MKSKHIIIGQNKQKEKAYEPGNHTFRTAPPQKKTLYCKL